MRNFLSIKLITFSIFLFSPSIWAEAPISKLVAQSIWAGLPDQSPQYFSRFIQGMKSDENVPSEDDLCAIFNEEQDAKDLIDVKQQLDEANQFFVRLKKRTDLFEVIPQKIYFERKKEGAGKEIKNLASDVVAIYQIKTLKKTVLLNPNYDEKTPLPLTGLLPGLAKGMMGMREGEKRKIFIHPEYGHADFVTLRGHPTLIAKVELKSVFSSTIEPFPLEKIQLSNSKKSKSDLENKYQKLHLQMAYKYGQVVWAHYKFGAPAYSLNDVLGYLEAASKGDTLDISLPGLQDQLVDLHWKIYQNQKKSEL